MSSNNNINQQQQQRLQNPLVVSIPTTRIPQRLGAFYDESAGGAAAQVSSSSVNGASSYVSKDGVQYSTTFADAAARAALLPRSKQYPGFQQRGTTATLQGRLPLPLHHRTNPTTATTTAVGGDQGAAAGESSLQNYEKPSLKNYIDRGGAALASLHHQGLFHQGHHCDPLLDLENKKKGHTGSTGLAPLTPLNINTMLRGGGNPTTSTQSSTQTSQKQMQQQYRRDSSSSSKKSSSHCPSPRRDASEHSNSSSVTMKLQRPVVNLVSARCAEQFPQPQAPPSALPPPPPTTHQQPSTVLSSRPPLSATTAEHLNGIIARMWHRVHKDHPHLFVHDVAEYRASQLRCYNGELLPSFPLFVNEVQLRLSEQEVNLEVDVVPAISCASSLVPCSPADSRNIAAGGNASTSSWRKRDRDHDDDSHRIKSSSNSSSNSSDNTQEGGNESGSKLVPQHHVGDVQQCGEEALLLLGHASKPPVPAARVRYDPLWTHKAVRQVRTTVGGSEPAIPFPVGNTRDRSTSAAFSALTNFSIERCVQSALHPRGFYEPACVLMALYYLDQVGVATAKLRQEVTTKKMTSPFFSAHVSRGGETENSTPPTSAANKNIADEFRHIQFFADHPWVYFTLFLALAHKYHGDALYNFTFFLRSFVPEPLLSRSSGEPTATQIPTTFPSSSSSPTGKNSQRSRVGITTAGAAAQAPSQATSGATLPRKYKHLPLLIEDFKLMEFEVMKLLGFNLFIDTNNMNDWLIDKCGKNGGSEASFLMRALPLTYPTVTTSSPPPATPLKVRTPLPNRTASTPPFGSGSSNAAGTPPKGPQQNINNNLKKFNNDGDGIHRNTSTTGYPSLVRGAADSVVLLNGNCDHRRNSSSTRNSQGSEGGAAGGTCHPNLF